MRVSGLQNIFKSRSSRACKSSFHHLHRLLEEAVQIFLFCISDWTPTFIVEKVMPSATTTTNGYDEEFLADRILNFAHNEFARNGSNFSGLNVHNNNNNHGYPSGTQKIYTTEKDFDSLSDCVTRNSPQHPSINQFYSNKYSNGMANSAFSTPNPGSKIPEDFHSLQNSPRYDRLYSYTSSVFCVPSNGTESTYPSRRPPQVELFPQTSNNWGNHASTSSGAAGYPFDRTFFISVARNKGFIVGPELEHIKENSRRSTSHTYGRISAHFRNKYGETEAKTKASYLQIGVRVPSKDHVSEIVGKGGSYLKFFSFTISLTLRLLVFYLQLKCIITKLFLIT